MNSLLTPNLKAKLCQDITGALMKLEDVCCLGNWGPNFKMDLPPVSFACNVDLFGFQMEVVLSTIYMQSVEQNQVKRAIANRLTFITPVGIINNQPWALSSIPELREPEHIANILLRDLPTQKDIFDLRLCLKSLWGHFDGEFDEQDLSYPLVGEPNYDFDGLTPMLPKKATVYIPTITHYNEENVRQINYINVSKMEVDTQCDYQGEDYYRMMVDLFSTGEQLYSRAFAALPKLADVVVDSLIVPLSVSNHCRIIGDNHDRVK